MPVTDPRIDAYIAKAAPFARPILTHLRELVHRGCPDVEETIKWGMPAFTHRGLLCNMAAFKEHATFGFWKGALLGVAKPKGAGPAEERAMGQFGRITSLRDLPSDTAIVRMVKKAAELNEQGVKLPARGRAPAGRALDIPEYFTAALRRNKAAREAFERFSPSHRREYVEWITEAKTEPTRERRIATALEWLAEGKGQNWRYETKKPAVKAKARTAAKTRPAARASAARRAK